MIIWRNHNCSHLFENNFTRNPLVNCMSAKEPVVMSLCRVVVHRWAAISRAHCRTTLQSSLRLGRWADDMSHSIGRGRQNGNNGNAKECNSSLATPQQHNNHRWLDTKDILHSLHGHSQGENVSDWGAMPKP